VAADHRVVLADDEAVGIGSDGDNVQHHHLVLIPPTRGRLRRAALRRPVSGTLENSTMPPATTSVSFVAPVEIF
jgi:hypothetical protein